MRHDLKKARHVRGQSDSKRHGALGSAIRTRCSRRENASHPHLLAKVRSASSRPKQRKEKPHTSEATLTDVKTRCILNYYFGFALRVTKFSCGKTKCFQYRPTVKNGLKASNLCDYVIAVRTFRTFSASESSRPLSGRGWGCSVC